MFISGAAHFSPEWKYMGDDKEPQLIKEPLDYEFTERKTRNYKN